MSAIGKRIALFRIAAGYSIRDLARRADVSNSYIQKIESGQSDPSLAVLQRVAGALNVHPVDLFDNGHGEAREQVVVPHDDRHFARVDDTSGVEVRSLLPPAGSWPLKAELARVPAGEGHGPLAHSGYDFGLVLSGAIELILGAETFDLTTGDSFAFLGLRSHRYRNKTSAEAELLWVSVGPRGT
jgi:transcriptional regulator with XRE-family HTH domain